MSAPSEWSRKTRHDLERAGIITRLVPPGRKRTDWLCEVFRNGTVYCTAYGATSDEALSKAVATLTANRLEGLGSVN